MNPQIILKAALTAATLVIVTNTALPAPIVYPANGHYYDVIDGALTWDAANAAATSSSFLGTFGHLATITDAAENLFLTNTFGAVALDLHWLGGFQPVGSSEPDGGWSWVTGEPFAFNNWAAGEPNNFGDENRIIFAHPVNANGKPWNDTIANGSAGYVVEYAVPEPSSALLLLSGAFIFLRRRSLRTYERSA